MESKRNIIRGLSKTLMVRLLDLDKNRFKNLEYSAIDSSINKQYKIFQKRFDSRIFFGSEAEYSLPSNLEHLSLNIIKVVAGLTDETKKYGNQISFQQLQKSLKACLGKTKLPKWLYDKLFDHLPPLFIKELSSDDKGDAGKPLTDKYLIFFKNGKMLESGKEGLNKFLKKSSKNSFDIFMEQTERYEILIKGNPHVFMAGDYHPFSILSLLFQRMGKSISYNEIYHIAIKPLEEKAPQDRSKKVYDYLKYINKAIGKVKNLSIPPEKWFIKEPGKGIVSVSQNIDVCLIISLGKLAG